MKKGASNPSSSGELPASFMDSIRNAAQSANQQGNARNTDDQMEALVNVLDDLEQKDPEEYKKVMTKLSAQMGMATAAAGAAAANAGRKPDDVHLPGGGNRVLGRDGSGVQKGTSNIRAIDVTPCPGFVIKTKDNQTPTPTKVFVNVVTSEKVKPLSRRMQLDEKTGEEQEGVHVPCSINPPRNDKDKAGKPCVIYDVMLNTQVMEDVKADLSGSFKHWLCNICVEHVERKFALTGARALDRRFKFPKLHYKGEGGVVAHRIRAPEEQTPTISEVSSSSSKTKTEKKPKRSKKATSSTTVKEQNIALPYRITCTTTLPSSPGDSDNERDETDEREVDAVSCFGSLAADSSDQSSLSLGVPLLTAKEAPRMVIVRAQLDNAEGSPASCVRKLKVRASVWLLVVDARVYGYNRVEIPLPFPVVVVSATDGDASATQESVSCASPDVSFDPVLRQLEIRLTVDRRRAALFQRQEAQISFPSPSSSSLSFLWTVMSESERNRVASLGLREGEGPDIGSRPWLLAQALSSSEEGSGSGDRSSSSSSTPSSTTKDERTSNDNKKESSQDSDSEEETDELPEDRFHRADIMSRYLLDEKKKSRREARKQEREKDAERAKQKEKDGLDDVQRLRKEFGLSEEDKKKKKKGGEEEGGKEEGEEEKEEGEEPVVLLDDHTLGSGSAAAAPTAEENAGIELENQYYLDLL